MRMPRLFRQSVLLIALALSACASLPSPAERGNSAEALAAAQGWRKMVLPAGRFELLAFLSARPMVKDTLTVYIEGDGFAWATASQPSLDPTPIHPVGLELALRDTRGAVAYLARPCQYTQATSPNCNPDYWTSRRFAPEVITASSNALDLLKARSGAKQLVLVGYSGGGAVAALLAARRDDVEALITVAGNLDHQAWTSHHHIDPLVGSLNPADEAARLLRMPQLHFVGARDEVMPALVARAYADRFPKARRPELRIIAGQAHLCCWVEQWPALLQQASSLPGASPADGAK